jgi:tRNA pseudouridine(55) synthase
MRRRVILEKKIGETPLTALERFKAAHPAYQKVPASYAGRLDPMASGKLLVLFGEECKKQKNYTGLDKQYDIEVLLDVGSDTGDVLGITEYAAKETPVDNSVLRESIGREVGRHMRPYPRYSSKTVQGKPLFLHTLEGGVDGITIPEHEEHIYRIQLRDVTSLSYSALRERITDLLSRAPVSNEPSKRLGANFRIDEVRESWGDVFAACPERTFAVVTLRVTCGSGTYMRSLAGRIGAALGTSALALSIHRRNIGRYYPRLHFFHGLS